MNAPTLRDRVRFYFDFDCRKHDLAPDIEAYTDEQINAMSNVEFLDALSFALEEVMKGDHNDE